jgi:hypothetical protein
MPYGLKELLKNYCLNMIEYIVEQFFLIKNFLYTRMFLYIGISLLIDMPNFIESAASFS